MLAKEIAPELADLLREVDGSTRARFEPLAIRAANACGCSSGALGLLFGAIVSVVWWLTQRDGHIVVWPELGIAAVTVLGFTMASKAGGILFARVWLVWLRHTLIRRVNERRWRSA